MNIIESILQQMSGVSQAQKKFIMTLLSTIVLVYGKVNFTNLGRYSPANEKTYRRHFLKKFDWDQFSKFFIKKALNPERTIIAVIDCSFLRKSGKHTEGKGYFYNGIAGKAEQELAISVISVVEIETHISYSLSVQQTLSRPTTELPKNSLTFTRKRTLKKRRKKQVSETLTPDITRVDDYAKHLKNTRSLLPESVRYLVADGYYYRAKFWKQFTGLSDCQSVNSQRLDFHFNASLAALNLAKYEAYNRHLSAAPFVFSMASYKRLEFNRHLLSTFISKLDLDKDLILNHPNLPSVLSYGTLAA